MKNEKIGVFLSAREVREEVFAQATKDFGQWIGQTGRTLVYGGSCAGLMEVIAKAVKDNGGRTFGVVPEILFQHDLVSELVDVLFRTANMADRKQTMIEESDILVALPGGVGTLDEVFTALSMQSIGYKVPRIVLYNVGGCWDDTLQMMYNMTKRGLIRQNVMDYIRVANSQEELVAIIEEK
ncbi:MAG: TIGR00730 family Rossman fold protein [Alloprevotella sp.]|nr:TIGR00730 family Rossman fold protein [Alloprevotella sp.]